MVEFSKDEFAKRMRVRRAELGISQMELAERIDMNIATVNSYEKGESGGYTPGADKLCLLAEGLECTPNDLLGWGASQ